jgi:hypothetical protein
VFLLSVPAFDLHGEQFRALDSLYNAQVEGRSWVADVAFGGAAAIAIDSECAKQLHKSL